MVGEANLRAPHQAGAVEELTNRSARSPRVYFRDSGALPERASTQHLGACYVAPTQQVHDGLGRLQAGSGQQNDGLLTSPDGSSIKEL